MNKTERIEMLKRLNQVVMALNTQILEVQEIATQLRMAELDLANADSGAAENELIGNLDELAVAAGGATQGKVVVNHVQSQQTPRQKRIAARNNAPQRKQAIAATKENVIKLDKIVPAEAKGETPAKPSAVKAKAANAAPAAKKPSAAKTVKKAPEKAVTAKTKEAPATTRKTAANPATAKPVAAKAASPKATTAPKPSDAKAKPAAKTSTKDVLKETKAMRAEAVSEPANATPTKAKAVKEQATMTEKPVTQSPAKRKQAEPAQSAKAEIVEPAMPKRAPASAKPTPSKAQPKQENLADTASDQKATKAAVTDLANAKAKKETEKMAKAEPKTARRSALGRLLRGNVARA